METGKSGETPLYLRIGTCSWKFDSWKGLYYDPARHYRPGDYLADYARHLDSVEIDQWFWSLFPGGVRLPEKATAKAYAESVPDGFIFTVKAPNSITLTHFYNRQPARYAEYAGRPNEHFLSLDLLNRFLDRLAPLGKKLGPVLFQFEYLNRKKMPSKETFFARLDEFFADAPTRDLRFAVETRNPNYLSAPFFAFLKEHGLGFVYLDGYYMPPIGEIFDTFQPETADFCVIRLHGADRQEMEETTGGEWSRVIRDRAGGLETAARIVRAHRSRKITTFLNVNNHYEGSAPITIERFREILRRGE
jgi:uncharacterized protein YecE (DUF72 family)